MRNRVLVLLFLVLLSACRPIPTAISTIEPTPSYIPTPSLSLLATVELEPLAATGHGPLALAFVGDNLYVAASNSDRLLVIKDKEITDSIPVGRTPSSLAVAGERLYVANRGDNTLSVIDAKTKKVTVVALGKEPSDLAVMGDRVYVASYSGRSVLSLDPRSLNLKATISLEGPVGPSYLATDPARSTLYASCFDGIQVVRDDRVVDTLPLEASGSVEVDSERGILYATHYSWETEQAELMAFDIPDLALLAHLPLGGEPSDLALDPSSGRVYITDAQRNQVLVVSPGGKALVNRISTGLRPMALALDSESMYVANYAQDNISVYKRATFERVLDIPSAINPTSIITSEDKAYVAVPANSSVYVLSGKGVADRISVGGYPSALATDGDKLYVADALENSVKVVHEGEVVRDIPVGGSPSAIAVDPQKGTIYVGHSAEEDILVFDANYDRLSPIEIPGRVTYLAIDPQWHLLYAVAWNGTRGSNDRQVLYIIDTQTKETILPDVGDLGSVNSMALDTQGRRVYLGLTHPITGDHFIDAVRSITWEVSASWEIGDPISALAAMPSKQYFLALGEKGTLDVYQREAYGLVGRVEIGGEPKALAVLDDCVYIVDKEGIVRIWSVN